MFLQNQNKKFIFKNNLFKQVLCFIKISSLLIACMFDLGFGS